MAAAKLVTVAREQINPCVSPMSSPNMIARRPATDPDRRKRPPMHTRDVTMLGCCPCVACFASGSSGAALPHTE
jgi:hypothetical protein